MSAVHDTARAALAVLRRDGRRNGTSTWSCTAARDGVTFEVALVGPDLPADVPTPVADTKLIAASLGWLGAYTLKVAAPRTVFEIAWTGDEPIRIMAFSRGAWEQGLHALARAEEEKIR